MKKKFLRSISLKKNICLISNKSFKIIALFLVFIAICNLTPGRFSASTVNANGNTIDVSNNSDMYINVKNYGVVGDGVTDDTAALSAILNTGDNLTFFIPDGNYLISSTLYIDSKCNIIMSNNARIFTNTELDYLIRYNYNAPNGQDSSRAIKRFIRGGCLDGNDKVHTLLAMSAYTNFVIEDVKFYNFTGYGLKTRDAEVASTGGLMCQFLYFRNWNTHLGTVAIYNNGHDNKFMDITVMNIEKAIFTYDGIFSKIHHWLNKKELFPTSTFAEVNESYAMFDHCIIDTIRYGFINASGIETRVSDCNFIAHPSVYTPDLYAQYGMELFGGKGYYYATNILAYIENGHHIIVTKYDSRNIFEKCRFVGNGATYDDTNYYPNDFDHNFTKATINKVDLNDYRKNGTYKVASINGMSNLPVQEPGTVFNINAGNMHVPESLVTTQFYYPTNDPTTFYIRKCKIVNGVQEWSNWAKFEGTLVGN